jgi:isoleucyl-tRNA synthetase
VSTLLDARMCRMHMHVQVVNKYGADALRLYLVNSPVVRAEPLRFEEKGVFGVVKDVFLPWYNAYRFLTQNVVRVVSEGRVFRPTATLAATPPTNVLDRWIRAATRKLVNTVRHRPHACMPAWQGVWGECGWQGEVRGAENSNASRGGSSVNA